MSVEIVGFGLDDKKNIKKFAEFPWNHYKDDPYYVPNLKGELLGNKILSIKGILTADHPYHEGAVVYHWLAYKDNKIAGRIAAAVNRDYNEYKKTKIANFSFFESIDDKEVATALFKEAGKWAKEKGMKTLRGPGAYSNATHEPYQTCLVEGFDDSPCLEMTYNYKYYPDLYEGFGFKKAKDYVAITMPTDHPESHREERLMKMLRKKHKFETRPINPKKMKEEVTNHIVRIYNEAWAENWGFMPIKEAEADAMADVLLLIASPDLIRFAMIDGKEVAVVGFLPDLHEAFALRKSIFGNSDIVRLIRMFLTKTKIERYRFMFIGVLPEHKNTGADALLSFEIRTHIFKSLPKAKRLEASLLLEDNHSVINLAKRRGGGEVYKRYRVYDYKL